mgnify:CR=1 FL=1
MKYTFSLELQELTSEIAKTLFPHVDMTRVKCFVSSGSSTRRTIARCHTIGKLMQKTIGVSAHYGIEFIDKTFNKLPEDEKIKVIIHELMHIPKTFGGGFRQHDFVCEKNVKEMYKTYVNLKTNKTSFLNKFF